MSSKMNLFNSEDEEQTDSQEKKLNISHLSLQIQLSATAVATSFLLILVPNVETISLTAFLLGFLFPFPFAISTILIMALTWEILASMVFTFSGITFPFKIVAWLLIGLIGNGARKASTKYFYEFMILGGLAGIIFDFIVTISTAFIFLNNQESFYTVLITSLLLGVPFTISHTISNALLFSFIPIMMRTILPLLHDYDSNLLKISPAHFKYLDDFEIRSNKKKILRIDKRRIAVYSLGFLLIISLIGVGVYQAYFNGSEPGPVDGPYNVWLEIDYNDMLTEESHNITLEERLTILMITEMVANVSYTVANQYSQPYIVGINGVNEGDLSGHSWLIYVNDVFISSGANITYIDDNNDGDIISWRYQNVN